MFSSDQQHKPTRRRVGSLANQAIRKCDSVKPRIKGEYASKASIFAGSKVLNALVLRGVIHKDQIENRIKVLKSAEPTCGRLEQSRISNPSASSHEVCEDAACVVGVSEHPAAAQGNTLKRKVESSHTTSCSSKSARLTSKKSWVPIAHGVYAPKEGKL